MVRELIHDEGFLSQKAEEATTADVEIIKDLLDTIEYHKATCVGMAANMIGEQKRIIVFQDGESFTVMLNPEIIKSDGAYDTQESCLSLVGYPKKCKRFKNIKVRWQNEKGQLRIKNFSGFTAQIIQHEIDHTNGILI